MSEAADARPAFSGRTMLALVAVGLLALSALAVLAVYAPDLRVDMDGRAHALSSSAVGYRGAVVMLKAQGAPVVVSRTPARAGRASGRAALVVLTPELNNRPDELIPFDTESRVLIVLPKWLTQADPVRPGYVRKVGAAPGKEAIRALLAPYGKVADLSLRTGVSRPVLRGAGAVFAQGTVLPLGRIDHFETLSGEGWNAALVDDQGRMVLAQSMSHPNVFVLSDPDLLNTQGLAQLDNARAGMAVLEALRSGYRGVVFDVTLAGIVRAQSFGRLLLEPPLVAATLCAVLAGLLMGLHGLSRFGAPRATGRAIALGKQALVENSAGLVRMARREAELAPAYAALVRGQILQAAGGRTGDEARWLADLARLRGVEAPEALAAEAAQSKTRDDLTAVAQKLFRWRVEMTRERR